MTCTPNQIIGSILTTLDLWDQVIHLDIYLLEPPIAAGFWVSILDPLIINVERMFMVPETSPC